MSYTDFGNDRPGAVPQGLDLGGDWDEDEVKAIVQRELDDALGQDGGTLSSERLNALKYYQGEPFGDEIEGRSQVVALSVLEAVEWLLPALMRIFTASDKICVVEPGRPAPPQPMMPGGMPPGPMGPPPKPPEVLAQQ